ncbi:hypothetical protein BD769DRAFT_57205 [Suillus cothurnatus]|nr:hypothetical protein BD769DRAFT_57205 [Suillus cothurnatus]
MFWLISRYRGFLRNLIGMGPIRFAVLIALHRAARGLVHNIPNAITSNSLLLHSLLDLSDRARTRQSLALLVV